MDERATFDTILLLVMKWPIFPMDEAANELNDRLLSMVNRFKYNLRA
jgi:endonuclease III-like uncharacterized protein